MPDMTTRWLGLTLRNPVIAGACTHTTTVEGARALEAQGIGAIVLKSVFEEQIRAETQASELTLESEGNIHTEAYDYVRADFPMRMGPRKYLERLAAIKQAVEVPVIASLNCISADRWTVFARQIAAAGADALELNIYDIADRDDDTSGSIEDRHVRLIEHVRQEIDIPIAVKLAPYYTAFAGFARRLDEIPVHGLVLFNRFLQPDSDIDDYALTHAVNYSRPEDIRLPLRWTAILSGRLKADIALSGGVHDVVGIIKALLAGAAVVQICTVLYTRGVDCVADLIKDLDDWMQAGGFDSIGGFRGRLRQAPDAPGGFDRAQYVEGLSGME